MMPSSTSDSSPSGSLFSPASCYPTPVAYIVDSQGAILHTWSHEADQPRPENAPPSYLRCWNHVEVDTAGNLFAIVPLRSLPKLTPASALEWSCDVAAHHDLAIADDGSVLVLAEAPRRIAIDGVSHVVLDNLITVVDPPCRRLTTRGRPTTTGAALPAATLTSTRPRCVTGPLILRAGSYS